MYYTVKTLLSQGKSIREISRELGMCRRTISKKKIALNNGHDHPPEQIRSNFLPSYKYLINKYYSQGLTVLLLYRRLVQENAVNISYPSVAGWIERLKNQGVYVSLHNKPDEESQVDFGYMITLQRRSRPVKVWVFAMIRSHSRYAYNQLVTTQKIATFIEYHYKAFEYFGGVARTVKMYNLKASVITPDFYEPVLQEQYAGFLSYYNSAPITCRVRRTEDKVKVESAIKYVKNNFLKNFGDYIIIN